MQKCKRKGEELQQRLKDKKSYHLCFYARSLSSPCKLKSPAFSLSRAAVALTVSGSHGVGEKWRK